MPVALKRKTTMPRSPGGKRDNPEYGQLNANIPKTTLKKIRLYCSALDVTISEAALQAFGLWLDANQDEVAKIVESDD